MKIIVDTGAWIALEVANDEHHPEAKEYLTEVKKHRSLLYTNSYVLSETYTRLIYDVGFAAALEFRKRIKQGLNFNLGLIEVDSQVRERTWKVLKKYKDHKLSFTDGTIVANYKGYRLDQIFTFDKHFKKLNLSTNPF